MSYGKRRGEKIVYSLLERNSSRGSLIQPVVCLCAAEEGMRNMREDSGYLESGVLKGRQWKAAT